MNALESVKKLEKSTEFTSWHKDHKKAYLAHCFKMLDKVNEKIWQIGYYNPETNLITVFIVDDSITKNQDAEVFKEQEKLVNKLELDSVKVDENEALNTAKETIKKNYPGTEVFKSFMILQNIDEIGQVWNITFVTQQFKTINIKINSENGSCLSHKQVSLIQQDE